jgi:hypothetical protein
MFALGGKYNSTFYSRFYHIEHKIGFSFFLFFRDVCKKNFAVSERHSVTRFFASGFSHESPSPKPLKTTLGSFQIFAKIRGDIRKSRCTNGVAGGKLPLVSTTLAANLSPVSMTTVTNFATSSPVLLVLLTPVANNGNNITLQTPESELEGKKPNKIIKIFLIEDFFHLPVANLELRISPRIFEKI